MYNEILKFGAMIVDALVPYLNVQHQTTMSKCKIHRICQNFEGHMKGHMGKLETPKFDACGL